MTVSSSCPVAMVFPPHRLLGQNVSQPGVTSVRADESHKTFHSLRLALSVKKCSGRCHPHPNNANKPSSGFAREACKRIYNKSKSFDWDSLVPVLSTCFFSPQPERRRVGSRRLQITSLYPLRLSVYLECW